MGTGMCQLRSTWPPWLLEKLHRTPHDPERVRLLVTEAAAVHRQKVLWLEGLAMAAHRAVMIEGDSIRHISSCLRGHPSYRRRFATGLIALESLEKSEP
jgi:hypothetical protein